MIFSSTKVTATLHAIATRMPPRPTELATVPPAVDAVFAVALAKRASDRFESAEGFAEALARAAVGHVADWIDRRATLLLAEIPWSRG